MSRLLHQIQLITKIQIMKNFILIITAFFSVFSLFAQDGKNSGSYQDYKKGFYYKEILPDTKDVQAAQARKVFSMDFEDAQYPTDPEDYTTNWHNDPLSQGATGTCWCFATTSFLESEIYRLNNEEIKLSEMHTVYWEYVERARAYVINRGDVYFAQGSEAIGVLRMMKKYGAVPWTEYSGIARDKKFHDHSTMVKEMKAYLNSVKEQQAWNEEFVVSTIKDILNHYLGAPPQNFMFDGKNYTSKTFFRDVVKLKLSDYYSFISTMSARYGDHAELVEPDNWWHEDSYFNIELDDFLETIEFAIENGYTISICGDVSEPGYDSWQEVGIVPAFDIPSEYIDESSREFRLNNKTTTDDHCIHIIGYQKYKDDYWFMIKDSGSGGFDGKNSGYRFLHQDYIRLKMMNIMVHKDGAPILNKLIK